MAVKIPNMLGGASKEEKIVTPTKEGLVVTPSDGKLLSKVTINGDSDLIASNIKKAIEIFGVTGTFDGLKFGDVNLTSMATGTFSSANLTNSVLIPHNLGKNAQIVIFGPTTDPVVSNVIPFLFIGFNVTHGHSIISRYDNQIYTCAIYKTGVTSYTIAAISTSSVATTIDATMYAGNCNFRTGHTYKWIVFA